MTLSITNTFEDGGIEVSDNNGGKVVMHGYDLATVVPALAHADAKHMAYALVAALYQGRQAFTQLWLQAAAAKSVVDTLAINSEPDKAKATELVQSLQNQAMTAIPKALAVAQVALGAPAAPEPAPVVAPAPAAEAPPTDPPPAQ